MVVIENNHGGWMQIQGLAAMRVFERRGREWEGREPHDCHPTADVEGAVERARDNARWLDQVQRREPESGLNPSNSALT